MNIKHLLRQDEQAVIEWLEVVRDHHERLANGFYRPPSLWQTFQKHALVVCGGVLFAAAIMYLAAILRAL